MFKVADQYDLKTIEVACCDLFLYSEDICQYCTAVEYLHEATLLVATVQTCTRLFVDRGNSIPDFQDVLMQDDVVLICRLLKRSARNMRT